MMTMSKETGPATFTQCRYMRHLSISLGSTPRSRVRYATNAAGLIEAITYSGNDCM
jgi:hypothetical protein